MHARERVHMGLTSSRRRSGQILGNAEIEGEAKSDFA
jgi:hypothetical protein